jgi:hypothetical protein
LEPGLGNLGAVVVGAAEFKGSCQGAPEVFMGLGVVASIEGAHPLGIELEATHEVGDGPFAFHQAAAARFHLANEAAALLAHLIGTAL